MAIQVDPSCRYTESHEWVRIAGDTAMVGISDYAQHQLSDVVYVELPAPGDAFAKGDVFGVVESVKAASDCYLPLSGEIVEINEELAASPELVNSAPFGEGWLVKITIESPAEADALLAPVQYQALLDSLAAEEGEKEA
ncbi:MAG: glycine cleavage system protein GcvH [Chloroflexota bacterium]